MGVSTHIEAIIPYDSDKFQRFKAVLDSCVAAGVAVPEEVESFFHDDNTGECKALDHGRHVSLWDHRAVEGDPDYGEGAIIHLDRLPDGVTMLRVSRS